METELAGAAIVEVMPQRASHGDEGNPIPGNVGFVEQLCFPRFGARTKISIEQPGTEQHAKLIKMRRLIFIRRTVWFLMVVMLMTGVGARGFDSSWVSHELELVGKFPLTGSVNYDHGHQSSNSGAPDKEPLSETEHQLLHAASHFAEPFPLPAMSGIPAVPSGSFQSWFVLRTPPTTKFERTFRPPRNALFLI